MRISDWSSDVCSSDLQVDPFDALSRPGIGLLRAQWGRTYDRRMPDGRIEHPRPHHVDGEDDAAVDFGWYVEALLRAPDQFLILRIAQRRLYRYWELSPCRSAYGQGSCRGNVWKNW